MQKGSIELAREQGLEEGERIGEKRGEKKGEEKGDKKARIEIAISLLDVLDDSIIAEKTGLSVEEIKELR